MKRLLILAILFSQMLPGSLRAQETVRLERTTPLVVILPRNPTEAEEFAAGELSMWLGKVLSAAIPIQRGGAAPNGSFPIIVGRHEQNADLHPDRLKREEAVVDVSPARIRIVGAQEPAPDGREIIHERGTLYGVYDLLNAVGVRWYRPEPWGWVVPEQESLTLPKGLQRSQPVYKYRDGLRTYQTFNKRRNQMSAEEISKHDKEMEMMRLWGIRNRMNTNLVATGRGGSYRLRYAHAYRYLVRPERYYKTNPEYFALIKGKRSSDPLAQLCLSNPDVSEIVYRSLRREMQNNPHQEVFSIGPNDGHLWCECDGCTAMDDPRLISAHTNRTSLSNRIVLFSNPIAKRLADEFPHQKVGWYAYSGETEPPTLTDRLEPNISIMATAFAGAFSDYSRKFHDPKSVQNTRYREILKGWKEVLERSGGDHLLSHEYWSFYRWPGPMPVIHTMVDRLRVYHKEYGVKGIYSESHPCWGPQGMVYYFYTWLLANPFGDVEAEKERYYTDYYGPASAPMRTYHERLEEAAQTGPYFGSGGAMLENLFTRELLDELTPLMEEATRLAGSQEPYERRVAGVVAGHRYADLVRTFLDQRKEGNLGEAKQTLDLAVEHFYAFPDGSVFDSRKVGARNFDNIFAAYRGEINRMSMLFSLFHNPIVLQRHEAGWRFQTDANGEGEEAGWNASEAEDEQWPRLKAGKAWQHQGYGDYRGTAWYRKSFRAPGVKSGNRIILYFDAVDGHAHVWLNGEPLGSRLLGEAGQGYDKPFYYDITDVASPGEPLTVALRVEKTEGIGGLTGNVYLIEADAIQAPVE